MLYTIKEGDTLTGIALKFYGDADLFEEIWRDNKLDLMNEQRRRFLTAKTGLGSPDMIFPGTVLNLSTKFKVADKPSKAAEAVTLKELGPAFNATNRVHVQKLALYLFRQASTDHATVIGGILLVNNLMKFKPWWARAALWVIWKTRGKSLKVTTRFLRELNRRMPKISTEICASAATWLLTGIDYEDADSGGGWSQREIDLFVKYVTELEKQCADLLKLPTSPL